MIIFGMAVVFALGFATAELMESEKLYKRKEHDRRRDLRRDFERQMFNLEMYGNINGAGYNGTRKDL